MSLDDTWSIVTSRSRDLAAARGYHECVASNEGNYYYSNGRETLLIHVEEFMTSGTKIDTMLREMLGHAEEGIVIIINKTSSCKISNEALNRAFFLEEIALPMQEIKKMEIGGNIPQLLPKIFNTDVLPRWHNLKIGDIIETRGTVRIVTECQ
jgi:hypothetical protein